MLLTLLFLLCYLLLSCALALQDIRTGLLPNRVTCPLLWAGLIYALCCDPPFLSQAVGGAIAGYLGLMLIYWGYRGLRRREGLGYGDLKFLAALGAWHGWKALPQLTLIAALLACLFAVMLALCRGNLAALKNPLPFGPFLAAAGLLTGWLTPHSMVTALLL